MFSIVPCIKSHLPWKFHENRFSRFSVMLLTDRQTNRQATDNDENIIFAMAEVMMLTSWIKLLWKGGLNGQSFDLASPNLGQIKPPLHNNLTRQIFCIMYCNDLECCWTFLVWYITKMGQSDKYSFTWWYNARFCLMLAHVLVILEFNCGVLLNSF